MTSLIALIMALRSRRGGPLHHAVRPPPARHGLGYVVDLLAAVPSVVYGLWGLLFLSRTWPGLQMFMDHFFGWIPLFATPTGAATAARCSPPASCWRS